MEIKCPCTGCGMCCRFAGTAVMNARKMIIDNYKDPELVDTYVREIADFPHGFTEDGTCEHLQKDNSCAIYETRPDICSIAKSFEKHHHKIMDQDAFFIKTADLCNKMQEANNIDKKYRVNLTL